ncbi:MAG: cupin domain-containing protein [Betaproteobacteria bacterium]|nr:cupin domain-containing protein [Betaproteobacteria bacterium]
MPLKYPLVHVDDVRPENMKEGEGWAISEFRLPISGRNGSSTTLFHSIFRPGSTHAKHLHSRCDEIAVYLQGHGTVGQANERTEVRPGHCRLMPKGVEHFFHNETKSEEGLVIGFYVGAKDVADTGYEFRGQVTEADLKMLRSKGFSDGILIHIDDVKPARMSAEDGWSITDFRMPIGRHNGSPTTLFWAKFMPGAVHKKHRHDNCEEIYYVIRGHGLAGAGPDRAEVRGGHVHYIPRGVEHFLYNLSKTKPLEAIGIYIGAGSVEETGYAYTGDVTEADIKARTA